MDRVDYLKIYPCLKERPDVLEVLKKSDRKMKYMEVDLKSEQRRKNAENGAESYVPSKEDSLERLVYSAKCQFADDAEGVEDAVIRIDDLCRLRAALDQLSEEERFLIYALFFDERSERELEEMMGVHRMTLHTYHAPVGFTLIDGDLQVNQAEVPTIQRIFTEYLSGNNSREIAAALNKDKALGRHWRREAIDYILQNERYAGNALLQKRYTTDSFPREKKRNRGEREKFFVFSSNEAIISQEMFDQAQQLRKTRKREPTPLHDTISRQIRCSCGARVRAKKINQKWCWCCCNHEERHECQITPIPEIQVQKSFCRLYYKLKHQSMKNAQTNPSFRKRRKPKRCCAGSAVHRCLNGWNKVSPTCSTASQIARTAYGINAVLRQPHILKRRRRWIMLWSSSQSTRITPKR